MTSVAATAGPLQILLPQLICFALNRSIVRHETEQELKDKISELTLKVDNLQLKLVKTTQQNLNLHNELSSLNNNISNTQTQVQENSRIQEAKLNKVGDQLKEVSAKCNKTELQLATTEQKLNETTHKFQYANQVVETLIPDRGLLLTEAVAAGNSSLITPLIQLGAPVTIKDTYGFTPADWAVVEGDVDTTRQLLNAGSDVHALHGENNDTLLHIAARNGDSDLVQVLLEFKGNPNSLNKYKNTPLHEAAFFGYDEVAKALLAVGAQLDPRNGKNITPLQFAAEKGHLPIVQLLIQRGADRNVRNKDGRTPQEEAQHRGKQHVSWWLGQQS